VTKIREPTSLTGSPVKSGIVCLPRERIMPFATFPLLGEGPCPSKTSMPWPAFAFAMGHTFYALVQHDCDVKAWSWLFMPWRLSHPQDQRHGRLISRSRSQTIGYASCTPSD
jgi:hypothetical protein